MFILIPPYPYAARLVESWKDVMGRATLTITKVMPHAWKLIKRAGSRWKTSKANKQKHARSTITLHRLQAAWGLFYRFFTTLCRLCPPPPSPLDVSFSSKPASSQTLCMARQTRGQKAASHLGLSRPAWPEHLWKLTCLSGLIADPHVTPGKRQMDYQNLFVS